MSVLQKMTHRRSKTEPVAEWNFNTGDQFQTRRRRTSYKSFVQVKTNHTQRYKYLTSGSSFSHKLSQTQRPWLFVTHWRDWFHTLRPKQVFKEIILNFVKSQQWISRNNSKQYCHKYLSGYRTESPCWGINKVQICKYSAQVLLTIQNGLFLNNAC